FPPLSPQELAKFIDSPELLSFDANQLVDLLKVAEYVSAATSIENCVRNVLHAVADPKETQKILDAWNHIQHLSSDIKINFSVWLWAYVKYKVFHDFVQDDPHATFKQARDHFERWLSVDINQKWFKGLTDQLANKISQEGGDSGSTPPSGNLTSTAPLPFTIGTLPSDLGRAPVSVPPEATLSPLPGLIEGGLFFSVQRSSAQPESRLFEGRFLPVVR
ncbi:MAG: hypothetical protein Q7S00_03595, partial [bacterium]|nr:hypothetical protein [bacterium]